MNRNALKKKFPSYFPIDNLPEGAKEAEIGVYRVCKTGKIEPDSFLTTYEENKKFGWKPKEADPDHPDIDDCSMSCFEQRKDANKLIKFFNKKNNSNPTCILSYGTTNPTFGLVQRTRERNPKRRSHVDWWLYKDANPYTCFSEVKSSENT